MNCADCGGSECICKAAATIDYLSAACRIFTRAIGNEHGYIPQIGVKATRQALELMKKANVKPVFYFDKK